MTKEIRILLEDKNPYKQGNCFEKMVREILETQRYSVRSDVNFAGMEIDLIAQHKDRLETIYVECKAKEKVSSDELSKFAFNVFHKKANSGLFIRTRELEHQAAGLLDDMINDPDKRYKNLTFFEPSKVIELLQEAGFIKKYNLSKSIVISKEILAITYFGDYYVLIVKDSIAAIPTQVIIIDAKTGISTNDERLSKLLKNDILEMSNLSVLKLSSDNPINNTLADVRSDEIESISEVQETQNWFDYLPASAEHFVGRDNLRSDILSFFNAVLEKKTKRRLFYLTGKSGWGKSSLVVELRNRSRNKYYKNRIYTIAIDSRSALSSNFVALSFEKLLNKAFSDGFIDKDLFTEDISFTSIYDLLSTEAVKKVLAYLKDKNKILVLVFDQFEDVFRKEGLFKAFYKFLSDTTDLKGNLIIGFSWKTEILIPSENEAYHYWQQAKEQAEHFTVPEFGSKETKLLIAHLEKSIGKIDLSLKRRLVESSQGYPWLLKKLCVHIYEQIQSGKNKKDIINENLNFEHLFNSDIESLTDEETKYLKYIAQRAFEGNFFETSEVNDTIPEEIINTLRDDKRLIIRSGLNYNVYWDIFRDYLVTGHVPEIGESYIIRSSVYSSLDIFLLFSKSKEFTIENIKTNLSKAVEAQTIENCLIDLRSIGLIKKNESKDTYQLTPLILEVTEQRFKEFITQKFHSNTIYQLANDIKGEINNEIIINLLQRVFRGYSYQERTWRTYANYFLNWLKFSNLEISSRIMILGRGKGKRNAFSKNISNFRKTASIRMPPIKMVKEVSFLTKNNISSIHSSLSRDLIILDLIEIHNNAIILKKDLINALGKQDNLRILIAEYAYKLPIIKKIADYLLTDNEAKSPAIIKKCPEAFNSKLKNTSKTIYATTLARWGRFINETLHKTSD